MKLVKRGRPPRKENRHVVWFTSSTLQLWNDRKKALGFSSKSNSEFAEALLHRVMLKNTVSTDSASEKSCGPRRKRVGSSNISPIPCKRPLFVSTPRETVSTRSKAKGNQAQASIVDNSVEVDITGSTDVQGPTETRFSSSLFLSTLEKAASLNPLFGMLKGDPMKEISASEASESTCGSVHDSISNGNFSEYDTDDDMREEETTLGSLPEFISDDQSTDLSATVSAIFSCYSDSEPEDLDEENEENILNIDDEHPQVHSEPQEQAASASETNILQNLQQSILSSDAAQSSSTISDEAELLKKKVENVLQEMHEIDSEMNDFVSHYNNERVVSEVKQILKLFYNVFEV